MTRTAPGRRALQVALLVGGLFVLGLLCGEQARAADGVAPASVPAEVVRSVTSSAERAQMQMQLARATEQQQRIGERSPDSNSWPATASSAASSATSPSPAAPLPSASAGAPGSGPGSDSRSAVGSGAERPGLPKALTPVTDEVQRVVRPVTEQVVRPVTEHVVPPVAEDVVRPIGDLVDQITGGITGGIVERPAPPQWWPSLPQLPTLPGLPGLPEVPLPAVPGQTLPVGTVPQQPGGATDSHRAAEKQSRDDRDDSAATTYGPQFAGGPAAAGDDVRHHVDTRGTRAVQAPVHQVPDGDPTGALGRHSAGDNGSPRHGDAQAVALNERARPTLVPGAAADVTAATTRDRHRDIPAFPG
ncbi:hypothetical protein [Streptomyces sp. NPDC058694]|uniref:hypothetical protein n=1 Tax=Streptomyces sp. NPDC058694 TaxID=3346603 RepID=UPI003659B998